MKETLEKIKRYEQPLFLAGLVILTAFLAFGLGRWSKLEGAKVPVRILEPATVSQSVQKAVQARNYVASKNGTKYHLLSCSGAGRIKEANRIYFATKEEAERAGYEPAANCPGI